MIYFDTETLGLNGPMICLQYAVDQGAPQFVDPWRHPHTFLRFTDLALEHPGGVCAWNLTFDWFQLIKWRHFFKEAAKTGDFSPANLHRIERRYTRKHNLTIEPMLPKRALDLMLHAQYGPYSHRRRQKDLRIPLVPEQYVGEIVASLNQLGLDYVKVKVKHDTQRPGLASISVSWAKGTMTLKAIHASVFKHAVGPSAKDVFDMEDKFGYPFFPFGGDWQEKVPYSFNPKEMEYALNDITMLQDLHDRWREATAVDEFVRTDSMLCCHVAQTRFVGFDIDLSRQPEPPETDIPVSPRAVQEAIKKVCSPLMLSLFTVDGKFTTKRDTLKSAAKTMPTTKVGKLCADVLKERKNRNVRTLYRYLRRARRFYPDVKVGGTNSSRMSGGSSEGDGGGGARRGSINPQGIDKEYRDLFTMGRPYGAGDFDGFEIAIAAAVWGSPTLTEALRSGKKIHALFGEIMLKKPYDWLLLESNKKVYDACKTCLFARIYGASDKKQIATLGITEPEFVSRIAEWNRRYQIPNLMDKFRLLNERWRWCADQPPVSYSLQGFPRTSLTEWTVAKCLYDWIDKIHCLPSYPSLRVSRKDKMQTLHEALKSALYSGIKRIEGHIKRALANHEIQSTGARVTKDVQYDLTPISLALLQVHDELNEIGGGNAAADAVCASVNRLRSIVPLLSITWKRNLSSWKEKG